ncbi:diguanylate cyclase [Gallaecimonas xiamenensis 3-C-1]|uniref:diguanylate cyclase n=2 Tax=Gallaecimonas TaxID=745410 RepID=K2J3F9_9GAMM|nr:diguanylate cyclase [Gallaecimonas xiamenensis 3-C-1]
MLMTHKYKLLALLLAMTGLLTLALDQGQLKPWGDLNWLDLVGEGCVLLVSLAWVYLALASRPHGRVTLLLFSGGLAFFCSCWLDFLDEFLRYPADQPMMSWIESLPAPLGLGVLTLGLWGWHREQLAINAQLKGREQFFREHQLVDPLTRLNTQPYLQLVLDRELALGKPLCLLAWDLEAFGLFNLRRGELAGDRVLRELAEFLLAGLRSEDLLCRLGGDRFVALLPQTALAEAEAIGQGLGRQLRQRNWLGDSLGVRSLALAAQPGDNSDQLLGRLMHRLESRKGLGPFVRSA